MVITITAGQTVTEGIRPLDLRRDIPQVLELLRLTFGDSLDHDERKAFGDETMRLDLLWRLDPTASRLGGGFVWVSGNRVVGNATLLPTRVFGRFLVANVAVHPDFRRRGIALALMRAVEESVRARKGRVILLQVVKGNSPAVNLYQSLGYRDMGSMTTWLAMASRLRQIPASISGEGTPEIRTMPGSWWRQAYDLDIARLASDLNWPEPLPTDAYRQTLFSRLSDFVSGRQREIWVTANSDNRITGLATISSEWAHSHMVTLRVSNSERTRLERPLLAKITRRLAYLPHRNVRILHPEDDLIVSDLLREANFSSQRTLTHMRFDLP